MKHKNLIEAQIKQIGDKLYEIVNSDKIYTLDSQKDNFDKKLSDYIIKLNEVRKKLKLELKS